MLTISILPEKTNIYRALAGEKESTGRTPGEALDALTKKLAAEDRGALVIVQDYKADEFFGAAQQERLGELMELRKAGRLTAEEESELENLVEVELHGARARAEVIASAAEPEQQTSDTPTREGLTWGARALSMAAGQPNTPRHRIFVSYLLRRYGSEEAGSPLLKEVIQHKDAVFTYALAKTRSRDAAEVVVQDVYARIFSQALRHSLEKVDDIKVFLLSAAHHVILEMLRTSWGADKWDVGSAVDTRNVDMRKWLMADERALAWSDAKQEVLLKFVENATEREKRVFGMVYHEGLSSREIAKRLGSDVETARRERNRVTAKIRYRLKGRRVKNR
jgi:RNA polymerase sigma factor (sigma-70 family)